MADQTHTITRLPAPTFGEIVRQWEAAKLEALRAYSEGLGAVSADAVFDDRMARVFALERRLGETAIVSAGDLRTAATFLDSYLRDLLPARGAMLPVLILDAVAAFSHDLEKYGRAAA